MAAIVLSIVLLMLLLCFLCVISLMRRSHQRKLRAAKAKGVQKQSFNISTPGTNMHVNEGSNPIWLDLCDAWKTENDQNSNTSKIYESKALSMATFRDVVSDIPSVRTFDNPSVKGTVGDDGILDLEMNDDNEEGVTSI
ncbi:uncharacterized protein LOC124459445 [Xenia sp. Carnegie-2017]|uniref:uncharacterized protein LOC124459445 n=1 Tax=Xenia sp. Carnegie-2017 TaxID=2897299 RepID=UPI001F036F9D|nr:uncharacterized protein LOC124459445 [Xenia sp. Carnegie-2017]